MGNNMSNSMGNNNMDNSNTDNNMDIIKAGIMGNKAMEGKTMEIKDTIKDMETNMAGSPAIKGMDKTPIPTIVDLFAL